MKGRKGKREQWWGERKAKSSSSIVGSLLTMLKTEKLRCNISMLLSIDMEVNTEILSKKKSKSCLWEEGNELREQGTTIIHNKTARTICFKLHACITLIAKKKARNFSGTLLPVVC